MSRKRPVRIGEDGLRALPRGGRHVHHPDGSHHSLPTRPSRRGAASSPADRDDAAPTFDAAGRWVVGGP